MLGLREMIFVDLVCELGERPVERGGWRIYIPKRVGIGHFQKDLPQYAHPHQRNLLKSVLSDHL